MARRRKRRTRTAHSGVKVLEQKHRSGATSWVARWRDPDNGKVSQQSLDKLGLTSREARREWAIKKAKSIQARLAELAAGGARHSETQLAEAIESYFSTAGARLRPATVSNYRAGIDRLTTWCGDQGIKVTDEIYPHHLAAFREALASEPRKVPLPGGRRGEKGPATGHTCNPGGVNNRLRAVKVLLNHLRRVGLLPHVSREEITDRLKPLRTPRPRPEFLRPAQVKKLLKTAIRHDAERFKLTREEHDGLRPAGSTPRHDPIAPFVAFVLLTGCRLSEALNLTWDAVDLDAKDHFGEPTGQVVLKATATKTHHERAIYLSVSPGLRRILTTLRLRAGDDPFVFGGSAPWSRSKVEAARRRMHELKGPDFRWQTLRQTTATVLTNAPGIFRGASAYRSARQLGHSVQIAERHYLGLLHGLSEEARTIDAALGIEELLSQVLAPASEKRLMEVSCG